VLPTNKSFVKVGKMRILVAGADGYIGFCLSMHLANDGFGVVGVDNFSRRR